MAPQSVESLTSPSPQPVLNKKAAPNSNGHVAELEEPAFKKPLKLSGVLDQFRSFDVTPNIGREFEEGNLAEWLRAPNSDELIRELAITSRFAFFPVPFRSQNNIF